ncbi:uncharacterized protein M421DRAFT_95167 [Didymella exigua CBS 183.55]|uniref:MYND-type domain-containing protein n=1 Tax=Didymella exigua CBS 183.55 TaxID=1150837 RepID=A0A6A5RB16_9PLEO|nr:uncharacterized protein M421DRAFT_95167 [Didymella exigua CBS 183.55]KAF1924832.1 hypothetical protein M421DRAFT_95167 [Didymella exigua CBS 183.55]
MFPTTPQDFGNSLFLEDYIRVTPPVTALSAPLCAVCHSLATPRRCSTCKSLCYCSSVCQTRNWSLHKRFCKPFSSSASDDKRPEKSYRRALYLPKTSGKPKFVWLKYGDDGRRLDIARCFPELQGMEEIQISYDSNVSGRTLGENTCVSQLLSPSPSNPSGMHGIKKSSVWRGPLVLAYSAEEGLSKPAFDIDPSVLGPVVDYLRLRSEYEGLAFVEQPQEWYSEEWKKLLGGARE